MPVTGLRITGVGRVGKCLLVSVLVSWIVDRVGMLADRPVLVDGERCPDRARERGPRLKAHDVPPSRSGQLAPPRRTRLEIEVHDGARGNGPDREPGVRSGGYGLPRSQDGIGASAGSRTDADFEPPSLTVERVRPEAQRDRHDSFDDPDVVRRLRDSDLITAL